MLTSHLREQLKFASDEAINPLRLFEDLHEISIGQSNGKSIPLRSGVIALEDSEGYARYDRDRKLIEILASEKIYDWLEQGHPRASYFVTHELGHCVLHTDQLIRLAQMPTNQQTALHRDRVGHKPFQDTEWQANAFASALLMPARGLALLEKKRGYLSVPLITDQFGVSREAAGYRLEQFNTRRNDLLR
jgi:Zn-dependent peptidase ImmA (M78 family)